ncbi:MAG: rRNA adenine N-6-methyltransferase family protein [Candidatus Bilamarchaeaceae archaeon]
MGRKKREGVAVRLPPLLCRMRRGPAVILPKDIGMVIGYAGIGKKSTVVEAGAGSGFATVMLANIAKKVVSYEWKEEFAGIARENLKRAGLRNAKIKIRDVREGIEERGVDLVLLDMPEAEKAVAHAYLALKEGGFLAGFLPHFEQCKSFWAECEAAGFREKFMLEAIVREYEARECGIRPKHIGLTHTAFLVFARK